MLETKQANRFALLFFLYFIAVSFGLAFVPAYYSLSYFGQMLLVYLLAFLLPVCLYFAVTKKPLRDTLRLNPLNWKSLLLVVLISFAIQPMMTFFSFFAELFFPNPVEESTGLIYSSGFLPMLIAIAVLPAVFEEIIMRGIILSGYRPFGPLKASLATALLFAMLHLNPQQFLYAFCTGFLFCLFVQRTNSIFSSILPHFIINGTTVFSIFSSSADTSASLPAQSMTRVFLSVSLFALLSLPVFIGLLFLFFKINPAPAKSEAHDITEDTGEPLPKARFFTPSILVLFLVYFLLGILPYLIGG